MVLRGLGAELGSVVREGLCSLPLPHVEAGREAKEKNRSSPSLSLLPCLGVMSGWQSHSVPHSQDLDSLALPRTELRGKEANLRVSPWSQGEVGADLDRSSSDSELPEAGCGDSAPAMS